MIDLFKELKGNSYPGRGIITGKSDDGKCMAAAYFIMGRSENSRNRVFVETEDGIKTEAFDPSKLTDPSLIIYSPVRRYDDMLIVTNGDQTDTIYNYLKDGKTFADALRTRTFEPDCPNFTPRISALISGSSYKLSILKSDCGNSAYPQRFFFEYDSVMNGQGHFIHTYKQDGNPLPSFEGEPEKVEIKGNIDEFTGNLWNNLNQANKVSLYVCYINIITGASETRICNVNVK